MSTVNVVPGITKEILPYTLSEPRKGGTLKKFPRDVVAYPWANYNSRGLMPVDAVLYWDAEVAVNKELVEGLNIFNSSVLPTQYVCEYDGKYKSTTLNMLTNSGFVGAVSGTPGTAPTGWTWGAATGSLAVNGNSLTFSTTASREYIAKAIPVSANTRYCYTVTIAFDGLTYLNSVIPWDNRIPSGTIAVYLNEVIQPISSYIPPAGLYNVRAVYSIGATGGNIDFRIGCGINGNDTSFAIFSNPQLTEGSIARPYVLSPVSGPAYGDVVDVLNGEKWLRTCGAVTNLCPSASVDFQTGWVITNNSVVKVGSFYKIGRVNANSASYNILGSITTIAGNPYTASIRVKKGDVGNLVGFRIQSSYPKRVDMVVDLTTGAIVHSSSNTLPVPVCSVLDLKDGSFLISLTGIPDTTSSSVILASASAANSAWEAGASELFEVLVSDLIVTATSYPVPYTPPGTTMPASHATTTGGPWFSLPQYDDVAQTRTNVVWAALDGEPDGVELCSNRDFSGGTTGWETGGTHAVVSGELVVTTVGISGTWQFETTVSGARYKATGMIRKGTASDVRIRAANDTIGGTNLGESAVVTATTPTEVSFSFTAASTKTAIYLRNGGAGTGMFDNISVQRIKPSPMTLATRVMMGVGSTDLPTGWYPVVNSQNAATGEMAIRRDGSANCFFQSYDGINTVQNGPVAWPRNVVTRRITQVNTTGTQFRIGYMTEGTHTAIQWSSWVAFDGSFNPSTLFKLMLGYNNIYPMWFSKIIMYRAQIDDAKLIADMGA